MIQTDGFIRVWQRNYYHFKKTWLASFFWTVLEPLMYLGAMGYGMGAFISNMSGQNYVEFFFPGLLCSTAMTVSFFEGTYSNYTKLTYQKLYSTIMLTPIQPEEIVLGELLWSATKGLFGVIGVVLVASLLGLVNTWTIIPAFFVVALICWLFSCFAMVIVSYAKNYDSFIFATSGVIVPMTLLSGIYFPIESLPVGLKILTYLLPLSHGTQAVRMLLADNFNYWFFVHIIYLIAVGYGLAVWSVRRISQRLLA